MWEEKRGVPVCLKKASSASSMPSSHGRSFLAPLGCQHELEERQTRGRIEPSVLGATLTVVGVENDRNAVDGSDGADVVGGSNGTGDGSLLLLSGVLHALAGKVGSATLAGLETVRMSTPSCALFSAGCILHDGRLRVLGSLEGSDNGAGERQSACFLQKD